jgi:osmoprotectant transport system permease protein
MGDVAGYISGHAGLFLQRTLEHLQISALALAVALVVGLPLALWLGHSGRGGFLAVNSSNIGRALPTLALLALLLPVFGLTDRTTIVALAALAVPPILTNAYTGIRGVDRDVVEAAKGMGMRGAQVLTRVELPLAAPIVIAGIRTSAVQVVATATLGAVIAGGGLGRFIVDGFATGDTPQVVAGAIAVAVLSILTEVGLGAVERLVTPTGTTLAQRGPRARRTAAEAAPGARAPI